VRNRACLEASEAGKNKHLVDRQQQADLARQYGIHGLCYYHYWFSGKQLLERPVAEILSSGQPDFPFCLCWAKGNWTRR
jgi:lipopolysaccharide biosynthesis protein